MADFILTVTDPGVGYLNANERAHWTRRQHATKAWREAACWEARRRRAPRLTLARIEAHVRWCDSRRRDLHNVAPTVKACVDGFVDAGLLPDDDTKHLIGPDFRLGPPLRRGERLRIEFRVYDLTTEETA